MEFFKNFSITKRLAWLQILLLAGLASVVVVYSLLSAHKASQNERRALLVNFVEASNRAEISLLRLRQYEKDFIATLDGKYIAQHEEEYEDLTILFEQLTNLAANSGNRALAASAAENAAAYNIQFTETVQTMREMGLDENNGLHGAMRAAVHGIESSLQEINNLRFDRSMLMMRRHEKDFIQRERPIYIKHFNNEYHNFSQLVDSSPLDSERNNTILSLAEAYHNAFNDFAAGQQKLISSVERLQESASQTEPLFSRMIDTAVRANTDLTASSLRQEGIFNNVFFALLVAIGITTGLALLLVSRTIRNSLLRLGKTVEKISEGNFDARTNLEGGGEIGEFSRSFDKLLDERVATLAKAESENETLNNSIIELMETVSQLSEKDLTVRVKVAEDVTGPVADSLNLMAEETAKVLRGIQSIAQDVGTAAASVQSQGGLVTDFANQEREAVLTTMGKLEESAKTMMSIAKVAQTCNSIAARASQSTQDALQSVTDTEGGMGGIRETISETEKRIKRLAERSQEITGIVEIINNISERTHVLALNASMQAAAAGDAGRGFAVVADEVQRLAESSKESTGEISMLVKNIQTETAEVMATMNSAITQVVDGTQLAQRSATQMQETRKTAEELSSAVAKIARYSTSQAKSSSDLLSGASDIVESTKKTGNELHNQSEQTEHLVAYSRQLMESVQVFRLA